MANLTNMAEVATMSVRDILNLPDLQKISVVADDTVESVREVAHDLDAMRPPKREEASLMVQMDPRAAFGLDKWAKTWRVSRPTLIRLCLHRVGEEMGFDVAHLLKPKDTSYAIRTSHVNKPFETKEVCDKRSKNRHAKIFTCESPRAKKLRKELEDTK